MIDFERAEHYIWSTARVLEQRRFEALFKDGDPEAVRAALAPYRTTDGGYAYALEPDGRGPTSQPPHIWTALESLADAGLPQDPSICDHLTTLTAPDGGVPVALPSMNAWPHAPWWQIGTEGTLLATSLLHQPLREIEHPWVQRAEAFLWRAVDAIEQTHPYEVEAAIVFLDAAADRPRAEAAAERLGRLTREQHLVSEEVKGYTPGEIHHPHDFAKRPGSLAAAWFTEQELSASLEHLEAKQLEAGGWPITWAVWTPAIEIEWSGLMTIAALKVLAAYDRL